MDYIAHRVAKRWTWPKGLSTYAHGHTHVHTHTHTHTHIQALMLGETEGRRKRGQQRTGWLHGITDSINMSLSKVREMEPQGSLASCSPGPCCSPWGRKEADMTERLNNSIIYTVEYIVFQSLLSHKNK